jgi:general secretion pathway protein H
VRSEATSFARTPRVRSFLPYASRLTLRASHLTLHASRPRGFTLIEILIVLVIVGITIALVGVNLQRDPKGALREEAQRLALLLTAARSEAIATGKSLAWVADPPNYGFYRRGEDRKWTDPMSEQPLGQGALPEPIRLALVQINKVNVPVKSPLVFSASGLNPPFRLVLESSGTQMQVVGEAGGAIRAVDATNQVTAAQ